MKKTTYAFLVLLTMIFSFSCEDSVSDEFENVNGDVAKKYIESISIISAQDPIENKNISLTYDSNNRLNIVTDGSDTSIFVYENGSLSNITGQNNNLSIETLYESPYDAFETGHVLNYDSNGNPVKILFYADEYNDLDEYEEVEYTAEITYDNQHNPYFYTLKAAGLIEVMDGVRFNIGMAQQASEIVQARALFPLNNPSKIVYKNEDGEVVNIVLVDYAYDDDDYPTSATVTATSVEDNETGTYSVTYQYLSL